MSILSGTRLGPYEIVESLGAGGMGEVWRAKDTRLDREVAIKVLPAGFAENEQFLQRFEREARAISSLNHPHVCTLYDVGEEAPREGTASLHYLVMELIEGESLADRLTKGPLPLHEVLKYGRQIASALDAAHKRGVIHRDLKPGNVMITKSGAKLLDFGLAKSAAEGGALDGLTNLRTEAKPLTQEGTILGTFQYMAPEQLEGIEADARTDIFALGALLYEMATGRRAFRGETKTSLIAAIVSQHPEPISQVTPMTPPALDHVVRRCLEKDPDDRWQSAQDIASELQWISEAGSQAGVAAPITMRRKTRERLAWSVAAILLVAAAVTGWYALQWRDALERQGSVRAYILPPENTTLEFQSIHIGSLVLSPDGSRIAFTALSPEKSRLLYVRPVDSLAAQPLSGTEGAIFPFWSPDGRFLAFFAGGKLKKIDASGGAPLTICDATDGRGGTWNEDGVIVFTPETQVPLHRVSAVGGTPVPITELDRAAGETTHRYPHFLPDGKHLLFFAGGHGAGHRDPVNAIWVASLDSPERKRVLTARSKAILAQGHLLYVQETFLMAQPFDLDALDVVGDPFPVGERVLYAPDYFTGVFSASNDGKLAFYQGGTLQLSLTVVDRNGERLRTIGEPGDFQYIRFSPDGSRLAVTMTEESQDSADIWVFDLDRNSRTRLTFDENHDYLPVWSPDGEKIAYSGGDRRGDLYVKPSSGAGERTLLYGTEWSEAPWDWSRDGKYIAYNKNEKTDDLWVLPLDGDEPFPIVQTDAQEGYASFSPDGRWIAYLSNESGRWQAYATRFPSGEGRWQITSDAAGADWLVGWKGDGSEIYVVDINQTMKAIPVEARESSIEVGQPIPLFELNGPFSWASHPDGMHFVIGLSEGGVKDLPITLVTNWQGGVR